MKIFFKVWNILILIANVISAASLIASALGLGSFAAAVGGTTAALGGFVVLSVILSLIPAMATIIMAITGLKGNYEKCSKIAFAILILDIIAIFLSNNKGYTIFQIIMLIVYILLAKSLQKNW